MSGVRRLGCALLFPLVLIVGCQRDKPASRSVVRANSGPIVGNILKKVPPVYPPIAKGATVQGAVVLHAIIAEDGTVESLSVVSGPPLLQGAAVNAVKQWVYKPYMLNGVARKVDTTVTVDFVLTPAASGVHPVAGER